MDKKAIKNEIDSLIKKIKEDTAHLPDGDKIVDSDVSDLLKNVGYLYQQLVVLKYLQSKVTTYVASDEITIEDKSIEKPVELKPSFVDLSEKKLAVEFENFKAEPKIVKKEEKIVSSIQKPKLDNLNAAIGLNDKFQFANELFEGKMQEYQVAIQQLNTAGTFESAMEYIESLQQLYNWDFENETVKRLLELVGRRYSS